MKAMYLGLPLLSLTLGMSLAIAPAGAQPASPDAMMSPGMMQSVDCSKAGDMMSQASKMDAGAAMTGDVDKDFMAMAMMHEKGMMMMQNVEMQCGKDPKIKAAAAKGMRDSQMRLQMFRNEGQSG